MHQTNVLLLVAAGVASAALQRLQPGMGTSPAGAGALLARQFNFNSCSSRDSCHDCFGEGYVICDTIGCFNPEIHQQCCKNAALCVGRTNNCCESWGGPGETGTSGVPNVTARPLPTGTPDEDSSFTCRRGDEGEECCQRAPNPPLHWCSGEFPNFRCYNAENQWCCTEGTVCDEEDCCELFDAEATHPWGGAVTTAPDSTGSTTGPVTDPPTSPTTGAGGAEPVTDATTTSTAGANPTQGPRLAVMGLAALGLGLL